MKVLAVAAIVVLWIFGVLVISTVGVLVFGMYSPIFTVPAGFGWGVAMYFIATWIWDRMVYKWR